MSKFRRPLVVVTVVSIALAWATTSRAQGVGMGNPGSSPDRSSGINPDTSRGMRGIPVAPTAPNSPAGMGTSDAYGTGTAGSAAATSEPLPSTATPPEPTSTTALTSAEYQEYVGAERSRWRPNKPLLLMGTAMLGGSYVASVVVGAISDNHADKKLFIPVAGPWLDLGERACGFGECGATEDIENVLILGSGVAQAAGLAMTVASLFVPDSSVPKRRAAALPPPPELHIVPASFGRGAPGIGAVGTF